MDSTLPVVDVSPDNWADCVDAINWRTPMLVTERGMRIARGFDGRTFFIPPSVWEQVQGEVLSRQLQLAQIEEFLRRNMKKW